MLEQCLQSSGAATAGCLQNQRLPGFQIQIIPLHCGEQTVNLRRLFELGSTFFFCFLSERQIGQLFSNLDELADN